MADLHLNPTTYTNCFATPIAVSGEDPTNRVVSVSCGVNDKDVRTVAPTYDGMERLFVNVPYGQANGGVVWQRWYLHYNASYLPPPNNPSGPTVDSYITSPNLGVNSFIDSKAIHNYGLSYGMELNTGDVVWLNGPNQFPL